MGQQPTHSNNSMQRQAFRIPLWVYGQSGRGWIQKESDSDHQKLTWNEFRAVTYNIWFSDKYQPARFRGLCDILNKSQAQIIGLQEMTKNVLQNLLAQPFIRERYYISDVDGRTFNGWYGVVLLIDVRLHVSQLNLIDFPYSSMGRRLILADIKLNETETLRIGTVHLESLDSQHERQRQLNVCQNAFHHSPATCILMGDFNFDAYGQENIYQFKALPGWNDLWTCLRGSDIPGYTFDVETNAMTKANSDALHPSRIDRIILKSQAIVPTQIEILGNRNIDKERHLHIFPSDHYGLTAVFQMRR